MVRRRYENTAGGTWTTDDLCMEYDTNTRQGVISRYIDGQEYVMGVYGFPPAQLVVPKTANLEDNDMQILTQLRALQIERHDMDDLMVLYACAKQYVDTYKEFSMEAPDWLTGAKEMLGDEIKSRRVDYLKKQLKEKKLVLETLKTREQKRADAEAEIKRLEEALK